MQRALLASFIALSTAACGSYPTPHQLIHVVDSPADVRACTRLGDVSPVLSTTPGFDDALWEMKETVIALGGTHLYLEPISQRWSFVRGVAYGCPQGPLSAGFVRAKG
ncbi:hypothetical protein AB4072_04795 [Microvirga sp. 2MCAF38]|uniref:hypothetical protein n=1 Tax=Microvirga sp. 2MCAF38 TaxID=3232989 RepID=UPI003F9AB9FA